jgi:hypothetical protein
MICLQVYCDCEDKRVCQVITHPDLPTSDSSDAQVWPIVVMTTPAMLMKTAIIFAAFMES